ncbi:MAG: DUF2726 domain-containing protein [Candidatus Yanofskybacteria bacterium]|nr:DUF2726 domain-containing protein [Candidatus Yanofskybacteria bacterium]
MFDPKAVLGLFLSVVARYWYFVLLAFAVWVIGELLSRRRRQGYLYRRKDCPMTKSEQVFYKVLAGVVDGRYYVFPQVHLDALLEHKVPGQRWQAAWRHINEKSVDFVLCDKTSLRTELVIELDDFSHERPDRIERDKEVERILQEAHLPLLRIPRSESYAGNEVARSISEGVGGASFGPTL